jgi:hypothetical protein
MLFAYQATLTTEIYVSSIGNVCIKQLDYPEEDQLVVLNPNQAKWLLSKLPQLIEKAETIFESEIQIERSDDDSRS